MGSPSSRSSRIFKIVSEEVSWEAGCWDEFSLVIELPFLDIRSLEVPEYFERIELTVSLSSAKRWSFFI